MIARLNAKYTVFSMIAVMTAYVLYHNERFLIEPANPIWEHAEVALLAPKTSFKNAGQPRQVALLFQRKNHVAHSTYQVRSRCIPHPPFRADVAVV
jgi:hypothetical protein